MYCIIGVPLHVPIVITSFGILLSSSAASSFLRFLHPTKLTPFLHLYNGDTKFFTRNRRRESREKRVGTLIRNPLGILALETKIAFVKKWFVLCDKKNSLILGRSTKQRGQVDNEQRCDKLVNRAPTLMHVVNLEDLMMIVMLCTDECYACKYHYRLFRRFCTLMALTIS